MGIGGGFLKRGLRVGGGSGFLTGSGSGSVGFSDICTIMVASASSSITGRTGVSSQPKEKAKTKIVLAKKRHTVKPAIAAPTNKFI